ncbi:hypothetical protein [uncultured Psychroserpens sp.]|uniref:hypothetical protein n=1 Tax=uncultured Psychroserpens sp. TaxID=255436 RepID=UPI00260E9A47|nr:hypothetical protein [uncultured Psychroserpens sp.]
MKHLIYVFSLLMITGAYAQNKPVDRVKETKVKTVKVNKDGEIVENKVKIVTTKEQEVKTDPDYKGTIDAPRVFPKVKVTKEISIDNDRDPFYDSKDTMMYYNKSDNRFAFKSNDKGFIIFEENEKPFGLAIQSTNKQYYLLDLNTNSGVGYFDKKGNFIVEYYNKDTGMMIVEAFEVSSEF